MQKLRTIANAIITLGPIGYLPFAGVFAALIAIPFVYFVDALIWAMQPLYPGIYMVILVFVAALLAFSSLGSSEERPPRNAMMITSVYGMLLVFSGITINIKFLITGCILFVLVSYALPRLLARFAHIDCTTLPLVLSLLLIDCSAGLLINFLFRFVFWLVTMPR